MRAQATLEGEPRRWPRWKSALWLVALAAVFLTPYAQLRWWDFPLSSALILVLVIWRARGSWTVLAGVPRRPRSLAIALALLLLLWFLFRWLISGPIAASRGIELEPWPARHVARFAFQALNEELVLGALPLLALLRRWPGRGRAIAVIIALVFAGLHAALYRFGTLGLPLEATTLVALAAIGMIRNAAILLTGHIGYAWALHAAWNLVMFAGVWRQVSDRSVLLEPQVLDALLGHPLVLVPAVTLAVVLLAMPGWSPAGGRDRTG